MNESRTHEWDKRYFADLSRRIIKSYIKDRKMRFNLPIGVLIQKCVLFCCEKAPRYQGTSKEQSFNYFTTIICGFLRQVRKR